MLIRQTTRVPHPFMSHALLSHCATRWTRSLTTHANFEAAIGNTPLIRLRGPSEATGCEILGKAEFLNPGGSVKDRAALGIIRAAEAQGLLRPGGLIVEGTAGNTGIGLTAVANSRGLSTVIVIPETQTTEKKDALRQLGARLVEVPARPYKDPDNVRARFNHPHQAADSRLSGGPACPVGRLL